MGCLHVEIYEYVPYMEHMGHVNPVEVFNSFCFTVGDGHQQCGRKTLYILQRECKRVYGADDTCPLDI